MKMLAMLAPSRCPKVLYQDISFTHSFTHHWVTAARLNGSMLWCGALLKDGTSDQDGAGFELPTFQPMDNPLHHLTHSRSN